MWNGRYVSSVPALFSFMWCKSLSSSSLTLSVFLSFDSLDNLSHVALHQDNKPCWQQQLTYTWILQHQTRCYYRWFTRHWTCCYISAFLGKTEEASKQAYRRYALVHRRVSQESGVSTSRKLTAVNKSHELSPFCPRRYLMNSCCGI